MSVVLVLGNGQDVHAARMKALLVAAGVEAEYLDTAQFPTQLRLSWEPNFRRGKLVLPHGRTLATEEIQSVFWRSFAGVRIPEMSDRSLSQVAYNDAISTLRSWMQGTGIRWVNSWQAYQFHKEKPLQLATARELGVSIPATLVSNDPEAIASFARDREKLIFKPVYGGAYAEVLTQDHLVPQRLEMVLRFAPITLQEYIAGTNIRAYVIGEDIFAAEIRSSVTDFRLDRDAELIPIALPEPVREQCLAVARAFYLEWTAIDWRLTPGGDYVFLEANPSPMFLHFEQQTGYAIALRAQALPIAETLVRLLLE